ncbi:MULTISPECIES: hypothetical protein [Siminovitchia]|uniref:DUF4845 domain-containing protein n=1 Tax=Siminovitchia sediminis TaxID=1274353 RepID=A0ABW4KCU9_9BACI|nr:hypothetical protein [Siminovitchia fortis]
MSEIKGAIFSMAIFIAFIVPIFLQVGIGSVHQHAFMKITTEVTSIVKEEGGVTDKVNNIVRNLNDKGYTITFKNDSGVPVHGKRPFGETIIIDFDYKYKNVRGEENLSTNNVVSVARR